MAVVGGSIIKSASDPRKEALRDAAGVTTNPNGSITAAPQNNNTTQSMIDGLTAARRSQTIAALDKSRQAALSGLASEKAAIQPKYYDARNQTAASSQQNARNFAEFMQARGGTNSGTNAQAELTRGMTLQGNLGSLGRQEAQAYTDIERRTSDLNNAYQSDLAAAEAGVQADRMAAQLEDYYKKQSQDLQIAQLMGEYNGKRTITGQQLDQSIKDSDRNFSINEGQLTGIYNSREAQNLINTVLNAKQAWQGATTPEMRSQAAQSAKEARSALQSLGYNTTGLEANVGMTDAMTNASRMGNRTLAGQAQDFNQSTTLRQLDRADYESDRDYNFAVGQQEWSNNFQQSQFDWNKAQQAWENTFQEKNFEQQMKEAAASRGLQWANLGQRQKEFVADQAFREKQFEYEVEQDALDRAAPKTSSYDYKADTEYKNQLSEIMKDPAGGAAYLRDNAATYIEMFGVDGYNALRSAASSGVGN